MKIVIVSVEEPIYIYKYWQQILGNLHAQVCQIYVFKPRKKKFSRLTYEALYNFLFAQYLYQMRDFFKIIGNYSRALLTASKPRLSLFSLADFYKIPIKVVCSVNTDEFRAGLRQLSPDLVLAQVPARVSKESLDIPRLGWINKHFGLLPDYRGVAPFLWAYWNREPEVGVTVHFMNEEYDQGDILAQESETLRPDDRLSTMLKRLNSRAANLMVGCIRKMPPRRPQTVKDNHFYKLPSMRQLLNHLGAEYFGRARQIKCRDKA